MAKLTKEQKEQFKLAKKLYKQLSVGNCDTCAGMDYHDATVEQFNRAKKELLAMGVDFNKYLEKKENRQEWVLSPISKLIESLSKKR